MFGFFVSAVCILALLGMVLVLAANQDRMHARLGEANRHHNTRADCFLSRVEILESNLADIARATASLWLAHDRLDRQAAESIARLAATTFDQGRTIDGIREAIKVNNRTLERTFAAHVEDMGRLAVSRDALAEEFDDFAAADRDRRERQADLFRFAAEEVNGKDLSETFALLAEDTFNPEIDGADHDDPDDDDEPVGLGAELIAD